MPTYDYRCKDCGHEFEIQQSFSDDALTECPQCGGDLRKVFSAVGISFKGSGFYKTDSRGSGSKSAGSTPSSTSGATDGGGSSGSSESAGAGASSSTSSDSGTSGSGSGSSASSGSSGSASSTASTAS